MCYAFLKRFTRNDLHRASGVIKRQTYRIGRVTAICSVLLLLLLTGKGTLFSQWIKHGPGPNTKGQVENITDREVVGAIHALAPHPTNVNILYVGAVNGGIWMTGNALAASPVWENQTDFQESLSIGALEFDPTDATNQTLVAGIGRFSSMGRRGGERTGLLRTTDGGANWMTIDGGGTLNGLNISGVAPRGSVIVISANTADSSANPGIWRSSDTGATWTKISGTGGTGLPTGASYDLTGDPGDPDRLYTNAGSNGVYRSTDMGATWTKVSDAVMDALLIASTNNIEIAVGTSNNVYVEIVNNGRLAGLFRSGDGGGTWTALDIPTTVDGTTTNGIHPGGQGYLHLSIAADPGNANIVYVGGDRQPGSFPNSIGAVDYSGRLFRVDASLPAGNQSAHLTHSNTSSNSSPHADSRDMAFAANGDLIEVDDGGVYRRTSPQTNTGDWFSMNGNIVTTEFHDIAWDANARIVIGGTQDTGTPEQILPANVRWKSVSTADGGDVDVDDISTPGLSVRYSSNQRLGGFRRRVFNTANVLQSQVYPTLTVLDGGAALVKQFYTPIHLNSIDPTRLIIGGGNSVYESLDQGDSITEIGPGIVVNSSGKDPIAYGATGNPDILYVGAGSQVFVRTAAAPSPLTASAAYTGGQVVDIAIDPGNPPVAYVIDNANVYRTPDAGGTWQDITGNLQTHNPGSLWSVAFSTSNTDGSVVVGGDNGVFIAPGPTFTTWSQLGSNLPHAPVFDLEYDATDEMLLAGTLGRGAWTYNLSQRDPVDIVLLLDYSSSMNSATTTDGRPKIDVLKDAVELFLKIWEIFAQPGDRADIVYFHDDAVPLSISLQPLDVETLITEVRTTLTGTFTAMGGALQVALTGLSSGTSHPAIILFTNGIQNVNPLAVDVGGHYEIVNRPSSEAWGGNSSVPENPGTSLASYGIPVHCIGIDVAAATPYHTLLNDIRIETGGELYLTTDPALELHQFYIESLVTALNLGTLEMVDYKRGTVEPGQPMSESFAMDGAIKEAAFLVHWQGTHFPDIKIDGPNNPNLHPTRWIDGGFYRIACFDFPYALDGTQIDPVGTWRIYTEESAQTVQYQATLLVDETDVHYDFKLSGERHWTGNPIILTAKVTESGTPIKNLTTVKATLTYPKTALGTLLSTKPGTASPTRTDLHSTRGQSKMLNLLENPMIKKLLEPGEITLELYDEGKMEHGDSRKGDGIFSAKLTDPNLPGLYNFVFDVEGNTSGGWPIKRIQTCSTIVRVKPDFYKTRKTARWIKKSTDGSGTALLTVIPYDRFENYLGPDYGNAFRFSTTYGNLEGDIYDALDGSYEYKLHLPDRSQNPTVDLSVFGFDVYKGPLSTLFQVKEKFGLSAHLGVALPTGSLNNYYDPGLSWGLDLELLLTHSLSLEVLFGRHTFESDTFADIYWQNISGNVKWFLDTRRIRFFVNGGGGFYKTGNASALEFGFNLGGGIAVQLKPKFYIESAYNYHTILITGRNAKFSTAQIGLRLRF